MSGFNSFGQASSFGMPTPHGGAGFMHYSVDPPRAQYMDDQIVHLNDDQIADLAAHAAEKHNQGLPLTELERKALTAYYDAQVADAAADAATDPAMAPVLEAPAPTLGQRVAALATPKNLAIGVGAYVLYTMLRK